MKKLKVSCSFLSLFLLFSCASKKPQKKFEGSFEDCAKVLQTKKELPQGLEGRAQIKVVKEGKRMKAKVRFKIHKKHGMLFRFDHLLFPSFYLWSDAGELFVLVPSRNEVFRGPFEKVAEYLFGTKLAQKDFISLLIDQNILLSDQAIYHHEKSSVYVFGDTLRGNKIYGHLDASQCKIKSVHRAFDKNLKIQFTQEGFLFEKKEQRFDWTAIEIKTNNELDPTKLKVLVPAQASVYSIFDLDLF